MNAEEIAEAIKQLFRNQNLSCNECLEPRNFQFKFVNNLNPKEQSLLPNAIEKLVNNGILGRNLVLTEEGEREIYSTDETTAIRRIREDIMAKFREIKAKIGWTLPPRWLELYYPQNLNPIEKRFLNGAIKSLIEDGFLEVNKVGALALTERGYNYIY